MPALLRSVGLPAHTAVGTNLVVGFFLGAAGYGPPRALGGGVGVLASGPARSRRGVGRGQRAGSTRPLRRLIGVALLVVAATIAVTAIVG